MQHNIYCEIDLSLKGVIYMVDGCNAQAIGGCSEAEGCNTQAIGDCSHAEGSSTIAQEVASHAEGLSTQANGVFSHTEGSGTTATGIAAHAEGTSTIASGDASHGEGDDTTANGLGSHSEGIRTTAGNVGDTDSGAHAEGYETTASGLFGAHAEGRGATASGASSHAEGEFTTASGLTSHAEGRDTTASGLISHAEGAGTIASGTGSHAEGASTEASGGTSHAEGSGTIASGERSHAEGFFTIASGDRSHAEGQETSTAGFANSHIMGRFGDANEANSWFIGNGTSNASRGLGAKWSGSSFNMFVDGMYLSPAADYAEMFETVDGNPIDVGYFVTADRGKIRKATASDPFILGITSATPSLLGDSAGLRWQGKYLTDKWGRKKYQEVTIPAEKDKDGNVMIPERTEIQPMLNPNWNPNEKYIPRIDRPEWAAVGLIGKILVRDDGTCSPNGYCRPNDDGIATKADNGYFVLKRTGSNQILVLFR
jgi:hypothetical protein